MVDGQIGVLGRNVLKLVVQEQSQDHELVLNLSHQEMESLVQERNHKKFLVKTLHARVIDKVFMKYCKINNLIKRLLYVINIFNNIHRMYRHRHYRR